MIKKQIAISPGVNGGVNSLLKNMSLKIASPKQYIYQYVFVLQAIPENIGIRFIILSKNLKKNLF